MALAAIYAKLTPILRDVFDDDGLVAASDLSADSVDGWDSFAHLRLILGVERAFGVTFTADDIVGLRTVGDLVALIERKTPL